MRQTLSEERVPATLPAAVDAATNWWQAEQRAGTLIGSETLWREAYCRHVAALADLPPSEGDGAWSYLASQIVFEHGKAARHEREAASQAAALLQSDEAVSPAERARLLTRIAEDADVDRSQVLGLLAPAIAYPWTFPRHFWAPASIGASLHALLAPLGWQDEDRLDPSWLAERARESEPARFLSDLRPLAVEDSDTARMLEACASYVSGMEAFGRDVGVTESQSFIEALAQHGIDGADLERLRGELLALREAVLLVHSSRLYYRAERAFTGAKSVGADDPGTATALTRRAANIYKRLSVAQQYPERLLTRYHHVCHTLEALRRDAGLADGRRDHVLLVSTMNSPGDLQRLLLSIAQELMAFGYGRTVHVIVSDDSPGPALERNRRVVEGFARAGMLISHWDLDRKNSFLDDLNRELFPDGSFDVRDVAGNRKPGEKGVPYGRFRNFLRLVALKEVSELGLDDPILTWLDQDNELGALVLTKSGKLSKRHVFNYFEQKSTLFEDNDDLQVAGGGYTNDALEGVEKFWVAWGILHHAFDLAQQQAPDGPPVLPADADITRFRPWDQADTLERLPREGENVETLADQVLLLLQTLLGTFRGKYDNQVQIYHPWTYGYVNPEDEELVEESRAFAGMPGGNTTFSGEVLSSPIPFITVGGRGEDIFHLWQLEAGLGVGSVRLTHTPALHTRNARSGRSNLMVETIDSYNGRILREPQLLWRSLSNLFDGNSPQGADPDAFAQTTEHVENLRGEAKARIAEISAFAAALEPYIDEGTDYWWVELARRDDRFGEVLAELRSIVADFKDAGRYQAQADEKLLSAEDVRELTDDFIAAYPRWRTIVERFAGGKALGESPRAAASVSPFPGYGSYAQTEGTTPTTARRPATAELPPLPEPDADPHWHEVFDSALALYRRYEKGMAAQDRFLEWPERVERLRQIYDHYVSVLGDVPKFVWARLFRDALLIPWSPSYVALTQLLASDVSGLEPSERDSEIERVAAEVGADPELLRLALAADVGADAEAAAVGA
ncbi:MAG TPA: hypothetical protein VHF24_06195 [Acidimicrobiales bacterium]|nr:hypothetical protein [Acidimicrobiales bacterium]